MEVMSREKQIEEMANILWHIPNNYYYYLNSYNDCKRIAECIYDDGSYRKQSEVAKEIFDEIKKLVSTNKKTVACATYEETIFYIEDFIEDLAELKKKYTGEKEDEQIH